MDAEKTFAEIEIGSHFRSSSTLADSEIEILTQETAISIEPLPHGPNSVYNSGREP